MKTIKFILITFMLFSVISACNTSKTLVVKPKVESQTSANGELTSASYKTSDGTIIKMIISKRSSSNGRNSEITFLNGDKVLLTLQSGVMHSPGENGIGIIFSSANGEGVNFRSEMDARNIILEANKSSSGIAGVKVMLDEKVWKGSFDFATSSLSNLGNAPNLISSIPSVTAQLINPFNPILQNAVVFYSNQPGSVVHKIIIGQPVILMSITGSLCRAACWAVFSAAAVACCGGTAGALCIACTALAAADASLCSDLCPP